jgi:uncharacterized protein YbcC (UPF0753/DUF2309 family)
VDDRVVTASPAGEAPQASEAACDWEEILEHAVHVLPSQGPIQIFVHHNTLHAFEHLPFEEAVEYAAQVYGCQPYLAEDDYRQKLATGRILLEDLSAVLLEDLGDEGEKLLGFLGTRHHLRLAMLQFPLRSGPEAELRWLVAETDALRRFRPETPYGVRERMIEQTRRWVMRDLRNGHRDGWHAREVLGSLLQQLGESRIEHWSRQTWEAFTLGALWRVCHRGVHGLPRFLPPPALPLRHRDWVLAACGVDTDLLVHDVLIRYTAAFLDQGVAPWSLPTRQAGFFRGFVELYRDSRPVEAWLKPLPAELARIDREGLTPRDVIEEVLSELGVGPQETQEYVTQTLLALKGWAGMVWQMETSAPWMPHPAPRGSLLGFLAVRLLLERLAIRHVARTELRDTGDLAHLRSRLRKGLPHGSRVSVEQRAFLVFQLAQVLGWGPADLIRLSRAEWSQLVEEIETFSSLQRRRVYHLAYERRYRNQTLDAFLAHAATARPPTHPPALQVCCCIDEREESFRRHLEEVAPACETFAFAGFFAVPMYYRGAVDAHYVPLCPIFVRPQHYVREEVVYSLESIHRVQSETRRVLGKASHQWHLGSRLGLAGALASLIGPLASVPLVARVLFPRLTARLRRLVGRLVQPPPITRLTLERAEDPPGPDHGHLGYSLEEMTAIVERVLRDIGLTQRFARLVIILGHGSSSLNNPHESAHDCGACGGGRGGPNARAFAQMANDPRVREALAQRGIVVPRQTWFLGAYHNTCDESVTYYDLDRLPSTHRGDFEQARDWIDEARRRNAHERCRRFEAAELSLTPEEALRHVEARAEDLAQVRPEYGHCTNAVCYVGRRWRTRGLFLDRRCFLVSYDPSQDTADHAILQRILQAAIPVCAGISLEYYFSFVDPAGYGCATKLPHNITGLLGVMDGPTSDLRTGLPWQMVELHEPVRILFVIEAEVEAMQRVLQSSPPIRQLVENRWVQLALLAPGANQMLLYRRGRFEHYHPESAELPVVEKSIDWYRGWRDHLGYARIVSPQGSPPSSAAPQEEAA